LNLRVLEQIEIRDSGKIHSYKYDAKFEPQLKGMGRRESGMKV
jgi:hypothetical protein